MLETAAPASPPRGQRRQLLAAPQAAERPRFVSLTLWLGLTGSLLLWFAFPPLNLPYLAWIALVPWLWLVQLPQLPGRWPHVALWLAGSVHWLLMLEGIRLAHPALYAGWLALSLYLGVYLPGFVGLTRVAVHRWKLPPAIAAPAVWVGLEILRGNLLTGFSMGLLSHSQAEFPLLIQISDLSGGYALSFVIVLVAACLAEAAPWPAAENGNVFRRFRWLPLLPALIALMATIGYGAWRIRQSSDNASGPVAKVALIQGSLDTVFHVTEQRIQDTFEHYQTLTQRATSQTPNLDLVVWPESMFMVPERLVEEPLAPPPGSQLSADDLRMRLKNSKAQFQTILAAEGALANEHSESAHAGTLFVAGTTTFVYGSGEPRTFNSVLLADKSGNVLSRYYKTHAVMFGEYIPFGDFFPWLYRITPMSGGLSLGTGPEIFQVAGLRMAPSVCFETTVPHLIRRQLGKLAQQGRPADALLNVTNDGWFWGSAVLDLHLRCNVFRAVENRKPLVVAANTGISAWIDGQGVIRARGQRRQPGVLVAEVRPDGRVSPYAYLGDLPAWACALFCLAVAASVFWNRQQKP